MGVCGGRDATAAPGRIAEMVSRAYVLIQQARLVAD
jgi:hypothetical protein